MKRKLLDIQKESDESWETVLKICEEKLAPEMLTGKGKLQWVSEEGQAILEDALFIPEIVPKHHVAYIIKNAPNKNYVFGLIREKSLKVPILIPRKMRGKLVHKNCTIEEIQDERGKSYRYVRS